jgi:thiosulfate/3-mercaptopyruvate sulfurtransferase
MHTWSISRRFGATLAGVLSTFWLAAGAAAQSNLLVSPKDLARELSDPKLILLQVGPKPDYDAGHIAGARLIELESLSTPHDPAKSMLELPEEADLRGRLERLGISDDSKVVLVAGADWVTPTTRVIWTLQTAGLGQQTRYLQGGSEGWKKAGLPVSTETPRAPQSGRLTLKADRSILVDADWVQKNATTPGIRLIDARAPVHYDGPPAPGRNNPGGHIAGARNLPHTLVLSDPADLVPADSLRALFTKAGVQPGDTVVAYCHIGQYGTAVLLAARTLGHPIKLYDGSFTEWQRLKRPIESTKK